uniref:Uncharacterized protein n=1 Tax=Branchiostoma floridae TaxID=7739 RepID=C3ZJ74_BRAFL|eukprot:XP_002591394.1 hypothetical protein BRAFLDRAFT_86901 [Branchiostoma floridae]
MLNCTAKNPATPTSESKEGTIEHFARTKEKQNNSPCPFVRHHYPHIPGDTDPPMVSVTGEGQNNRAISATGERQNNRTISATGERQNNRTISATGEGQNNRTISATGEGQNNRAISATGEGQNNRTISATPFGQQPKELLTNLLNA